MGLSGGKDKAAPAPTSPAPAPAPAAAAADAGAAPAEAAAAPPPPAAAAEAPAPPPPAPAADAGAPSPPPAPGGGPVPAGCCPHCRKEVNAVTGIQTLRLAGQTESVQLHFECTEAYKWYNSPTCAHCSKKVTGGHTYLDEGSGRITVHPECADPYLAGSRPACAKCGDKIMDDGWVTGARGEPYHKACHGAGAGAGGAPPRGAACGHCGRPIEDASMHLQEPGGKNVTVHPECVEPFKVATRPKCTTCGQPIVDDGWITGRDGETWHRGCVGKK